MLITPFDGLYISKIVENFERQYSQTECFRACMRSLLQYFSYQLASFYMLGYNLFSEQRLLCCTTHLLCTIVD